MEYSIFFNVYGDNFPNDISQEVSEGAQTIKKISLQDPDEEKFGRMKECLEYL